MSRSLYSRLRRRYRPQPTGFSRREFLQLTLAASAGWLTSCATTFQGAKIKPHGRRVVVVGAGFSGLACAYELLSAGYTVTVVEARKRVGGRVVSFHDLVRGKTIEGGGELIGSNHPTWVAYAKQFGLNFIDVTEDENLATPVLIGGNSLSEKQTEALWEEMEGAYGSMTEDARSISADAPWKSPNASSLDHRSTASWLAGLGLSHTTRTAMRAELSADNAVAIERQSYLGNLTQIKGGGLEKYWDESEVYRCKGGNDQLAKKLARAIGSSNLRLNTPVSAIATNDSKVTVTCADGTVLEADDVVFTVPPSVWGKINITPDLPSVLRPQMGVAVKYLAEVKTRFWKADGLSPDSLTDKMVSMTWDGADNQPGDPAALISFSGGPAARECREAWQESGDEAFHRELSKIYPKYRENFVEARFMDWPGDPLTGAGYSFPAPGQITAMGPLLHRGVGHLHFAGEYTCYKFVGYMEGALNSGASLASRIAKRDGVV